jgi:hypothetical protein
MGVFTAQPFSVLLASSLLALGFALLGTVLLMFVCVYRSADRLLVQRVLSGGDRARSASADLMREQPLELICSPRVQSDVRRPGLAGRAAAPSRAPPILPSSRAVDLPDPAAASDASVLRSRSRDVRPGPDPR